MRILYQPAQANPNNWESCDFDTWASLGEFDVNAVCVQGTVFEGPDHYGIRKLPNGDLIVAGWHTDLADWPVGFRWAREIQFRPLARASDPRLGGAITTHQTTKLYAEAGALPLLQAAYQDVVNVSVHPWSNFSTAPYASKPGRWLTTKLYEAHQKRRQARSWREWSDGVDPGLLDHEGKVKDQRKMGRYVTPKGTRTYFHNPVAGPSPLGASTVNSLGLEPTGLSNQSSGNVSGNGILSFEAVGPVGEPDSAQWPTTGEYRYQLDVASSGNDLVFGLSTIGTAQGGFLRVDAAGTSVLQRITQSQALFSGAGLWLASVTNPAWSAGATTDRVGVSIAAQRIAGHGNQTFILQTGEFDDFIDAPWIAASESGQDAALLGCNF